MSSLAMSVEQRAAFLAEPRVAVLAVQDAGGGAPIVGPVWYHYEPGGDVQINIGASSAKAAAIASSPELTLCSSDESLPYRFVSVSGRATLEPTDADLRRTIAARYLPAEMVDGYLASTEDSASVTVRFTPTRWRSNDFGRMVI